MNKDCRITEEELEHYIKRARAAFGRRPTVEDYELLAEQAEQEGRYYAAALYLELAEVRSHPDEEAVMRLETRVNELLALAGTAHEG